MKLLSITGISRGRNFFFGNSRYTRGMLRYGYCDECLSHETEMAHDRARWITANFITGSGLWLLSLSYAKIRLLVGGQNIVCGGYLRGGGRARVELSTKVRLRLPPRSTLLSYCIVSTPRCAVLEQVFSPFTFAPFSRSRRPSLPSCFVIASPLLLLTSLSSSLPGHSTLSSSRAALAKLRVFRALNSYGLNV